MFVTYILYSKEYDKYYIGHTNDIKRRLEEHNSDKAGWTRSFQPWEIVHTEKFEVRAEALKKEVYLKSLKNKERLKQYIAGWRSSISGGS